MELPTEHNTPNLLSPEVIGSLSDGHRLSSLITFLGDLEAQGELKINGPYLDGYGVKVGPDAYQMPDNLMIDPKTRLHIVQPGSQVTLSPGECAVSPGFFGCSALAATVGDHNLLFSHIPTYELRKAVKQVADLNDSSGVEAALVVSQEPNLYELLRKDGHFKQGENLRQFKVSSGEDFFRVWVYLNPDSQATFGVTKNDFSNEPLETNPEA